MTASKSKTAGSPTAGSSNGPSASSPNPCPGGAAGSAANAAAASAVAAAAAKLVPALPGGGEPISILLVDDDPDCRMLFRDAICDSKVCNSIFEVSNGQEALDFLNRRGKYADAPRPGLIFMDIEMPVKDGLATLHEIKTDPKLRDIPVVMMTGVCGEPEMNQAAAAGANSYTLKPANAEQFLQTVLASTSYWLEIHQYPRHHWPAEACRR